MIVRVTASTDPWASLVNTKETYERLVNEGKDAVTVSKSKGIAAPNLEAVVKAVHANGSVSDTVDPKRLESAIKELNTIKAFNPIGTKK
ncbi:MAG: hypothetical protein ACJ8NR_12945 [Sulfurifustis sp.]